MIVDQLNEHIKKENEKLNKDNDSDESATKEIPKFEHGKPNGGFKTETLSEP